LSVIVLLFVIV